MSCVYRWVEHTGELELEIEAQSEEAVFHDALAAVFELTGGEASGSGKIPPPGERPVLEAREVVVAASERALLLVEWLEELLFLAETEAFVPGRIVRLELGRDRLSATIEGRSGQPRHLVKAVTYHRLRFERSGDQWHAGVVLDV
jgi:SHS2 domain-containing protein